MANDVGVFSPEFIFRALSALAVCLVRIIANAIFVAVTHPHIRYAFAVSAFEMILGAWFQLAVRLVVAVRTLFDAVAPFAAVNTESRLTRRRRALELPLKAHVLVAIDLVASIAALIFTVANMRWADAFSVAALILARFACKWST